MKYRTIMTPSKYAKEKGLKGGLKEISNQSGVSAMTLRNWYYDKPKLFDLVLYACIKKREEMVKKDERD